MKESSDSIAATDLSRLRSRGTLIAREIDRLEKSLDEAKLTLGHRSHRLAQAS